MLAEINATSKLAGAFCLGAAILVGCANTTVNVGGQTLTFDDHGDIIVEQPECPFKFTPQLSEQLKTIIQEKLGNAVNSYSSEPGLIYYRKYATLLYNPLPSPRGMGIVDGSDLVVKVNVCTLRVEKVYFEIPTP